MLTKLFSNIFIFSDFHITIKSLQILVSSYQNANSLQPLIV